MPHSAGTLPNRRALKNARMVSRKDDVHLCVMCLRAIMNYQVGTEVALSLRRVGGQHGDTATIVGIGMALRRVGGQHGDTATI